MAWKLDRRLVLPMVLAGALAACGGAEQEPAARGATEPGDTTVVGDSTQQDITSGPVQDSAPADSR